MQWSPIDSPAETTLVSYRNNDELERIHFKFFKEHFVTKTNCGKYVAEYSCGHMIVLGSVET